MEAARSDSIQIPALGYDPGVSLPSTVENAFVEVEEGGKKKFVSATSTLVHDGMAVYTDFEDLTGYRNIYLLSLLKNHCGDCIGIQCYIQGSWRLLEGLAAELRRRRLSERFRIKARLCTVQYEGGPNVVIGKKIVSQVDTATASAFIDAHLMQLLEGKQ